MSARTASAERPAPAESWVTDDVAFLDELTDLGMSLARELTREVTAHGEAVESGEAPPLTPDQCCRAARRFTRIARGVRLTLILKARVRAGNPPPGQPGPLREALRRYILSGPPVMEAAVAGPAATKAESERAERNETAEAERLVEDLERDLNREIDLETFKDKPIEAMVGQIFRDLGIKGGWQPLKTEDGDIHAWIAPNPADPTTPIVWPYPIPPTNLIPASARARAPP